MVGYPFDSKDWAPDLISPIETIIAVTPTDDTDITVNGVAVASRAVYVGASGDLEVTDMHGNKLVVTGLAGGVWHAMRVTRVHATLTTATNVLIGY